MCARSAGVASAQVSWIPFPDGQTVTSYTIRNLMNFDPADDAGCDRWSAPGSTRGAYTSITIPGLTNNIRYQFMVAATDAAGTSQFSEPSNIIMPLDPTVPRPQPM